MSSSPSPTRTRRSFRKLPKQTEAGAAYMDVNVGTAAADQEATIQWLVETIQETCSTPLCLDSQKPDVIAAGLKVINAEHGVMLNSTPLNKKSDEEIFDKYIEMALDDKIYPLIKLAFFNKTRAGFKINRFAIFIDKIQ